MRGEALQNQKTVSAFWVGAFLCLLLFFMPRQALSCGCGPAVGIGPAGRSAAAGAFPADFAAVTAAHPTTQIAIKQVISEEFWKQQQWVVDDFWNETVKKGLQDMTRSFFVVGMNQILMIGSILDGKMSLETIREHKRLQAMAHKNYHVVGGLCVMGSVARGMPNAVRRSEIFQRSVNRWNMARQLGSEGSYSAKDPYNDLQSRYERLRTVYCDPGDGNGGLGATGLCSSAAMGNATRQNLDIDYTRLIDRKMTLDFGISTSNAPHPDQEDVFSLMANLYGHDVMLRPTKGKLLPIGNQESYLDMRALMAKRNVAVNSMSALVAKKVGSKNRQGASASLKAALTNAALSGSKEFVRSHPNDLPELEEAVGERPSYWAMMEFLTKEMPQDPRFMGDLMVSPTSIGRMQLAMQSYKSVQKRDTYESLLRSEVLLSLLVEMEAEDLTDELDRKVRNLRAETSGKVKLR